MAYQEKWGESESCSVLFDSLWPHRLYSPWNSLRNMGNVSLLQGIFPTQGSNPGMPHWKKVKSLSCVQLFAIPWTAARQASLSLTISWSLLKLMSVESVMPSNHLILWRPLLLPSIFPRVRVFSKESVVCIRWPKYWSFNLSIKFFQWIFRTDFL